MMNNRPTPKKKDDSQMDLEQHFILRMPPGPAMALRHDVETGSMLLKDRFFIEINHDMRHGTVRYGDQVFNAKLVDIPCIIETLKTTDSKTFYKAADISQMLVCVNEDEPSTDEGESPKKKDKDKKYQWIHGITPPLKNVRKRRFRKTLQKKYQDQPEIEKEVKRLFRMDNEAVDVKWEVIVEEDTANNTSNQQQVVAHGAASNANAKPKNQASMLDIDEADIFGEVSSSEDEVDVNVLDSGDETSRGPNTPGRAGAMEGEEVRDTEFFRTDSNTQMAEMFSEEADNAELQNKLAQLEYELEELRKQRRENEMKLDGVNSPFLKERISNILEKIQDQENEKTKEFEILSSILTQS